MGIVVGYQYSRLSFSNKAYMHVSTDDYQVAIKFDPRQIKLVQEEFPRGSEVPLEFYSGEWHIGSKPPVQDISAYDPDVIALKMLNKIGSQAE